MSAWPLQTTWCAECGGPCACPAPQTPDREYECPGCCRLRARLEALERRVAELDSRTKGSILLGWRA